MTDPKKEIDRLQREIDDVRTNADRASKGEPPKPVLYKPQSLGLGAVHTRAGMLVILVLSVSLARQFTKDQETYLTKGSVGAAGGLVVGYTVGVNVFDETSHCSHTPHRIPRNYKAAKF